MKIVEVKNVRIGDGIPKICVSIIAETIEDVIIQAKNILEAPVDLVEWRGDYFYDIFQKDKALEALKVLRKIIPQIPILFTFRTSEEGGKRSIFPEDYCNLNKYIVSTGLVDLIDVEAFSEEGLVKDIIKEAHRSGIKVIASNHDFYKTPSKEEIIRRLRYMQVLGADIPKIALMPQRKRDVLTVLEATLEMSESYGDTPIVTISMSGSGVISRVAGEFFGSAITFGALGRGSAPGQIDVQSLSKIIDVLHESLNEE